MSAEQAEQWDEKACSVGTSENTPFREPFEGPLIGSAMATFGLCCTAAVGGLIAKKYWQRHRKAAAKTAVATEPTHSSEAAMQLQEKNDTAA